MMIKGYRGNQKKVARLLLLMCVIFFPEAAHSQNRPGLLRFEEDYATVGDSLKKRYPSLRFKNIGIDKGSDIRLSFGLDYREMYELVEAYDSVGTNADGFWTTRLMMYVNAQVGKRIRFFVQPARGVITGRKLPPRPVDVDQLFLLNGFAEYRFGGKNKGYMRLGRQELVFGMGRLIAPREGPNIRNSYDGARLHYAAKAFTTDLFFTYTVNNRPGIFDNQILGNNQRLWGMYNSWKNKRVNADIYYIGFYNPTALYSKQPQRAKETRHTTGLRAYGKLNKSISYDGELVYQFGRFGKYNIRAFLGDIKVTGNYGSPQSSFKTSVKFTWASGNRSLTNNQLTTYNPLFPNLLYYQTAIGIFPANLINPQLLQEWRYEKLSIACGLDLFWRQTASDVLYAPFGNLSPGTGNDTYLGSQFFNKIDFTVTQNLGFTFLMSRYFKSDFIKRSPNKSGVDLLLGILMNYKL
jgi:Alginate export